MSDPASVDERIAQLPEWQARMMRRIRSLILTAEPEMVEEVKWRKPTNNMLGVAAWSADGLVCTGEPYKDKLKFTFARGAALNDSAGVFNAGFGGGTRRAIDLFEGDTVDPTDFVDLVKAAVALNGEPK